MNLHELAVEPQLVKLTIKEESIVTKYGEELDFYVYDRQSLDVFAKLSAITEDTTLNYTDMLSKMILDEHGHPVMDDTKVLPIDVLTEAIKLVGEALGK
ncbi:hypothetical protein N8955_01275 [bacterium]|jgi:hypothetical protein|nr:hypothetical protein [bacterium]